MNHTPPQTGGTPEGTPPTAPFGAGFFAWIRGLGIGRGGDRWFAGVAGGIAMRAGIDPIIVRGLFIVLAVLGGPGIVLYLLGWLLLPDQGGRIHLEEVFRGRAGTAAVVATVAVGVFVVFPTLFRILGVTTIGGWSIWNAFGMPHWLTTTISVLVWIAVIAVAGYLVSRLVLQHGRKVRDEGQQATYDAPATEHPGAPTADPSGAQTAQAPQQTYAPQAPQAFAAAPSGSWPAPDASAPAATPGGEQDWATRFTEKADRASERAARWSEDVGKQADEWSARYAAQHDMMKLGAAHVVITLALALLAAGGASYIAFDMQLDSSLMVTAALLGATGVLAVSLIVAGIRGRQTGWVGFLAACGVIALLFTAVLPQGTRFQPFGNVQVTADDTGAVLIGGNTDIDLTTLDSAPGWRNIDIWQVAGRSTITLPSREDVKLTVRVLAGTIDASNLSSGASTAAGPFLSRTIDTRDDITDEASQVTVYLLAGSVHVNEAGRAGARPTASAGSGTSENRADLREELSDLREEEGQLEHELDAPGLSEVRQERLENTLDFTRDEIAKLEKELAR